MLRSCTLQLFQKYTFPEAKLESELVRPWSVTSISICRLIRSIDPFANGSMALSGSITIDDASFFARACERSGPISRILSRVLLLSN